MKYKEWSMPSGSPRVRQNLEAAGIPALLAAILAARGITQPDQARRLLTPGAEPVLDPMLLRDMDRAAARVRRALEQMGFSVLPSRTNFLFATKDGASMRELFLYLKQRHIYIRYFDLPRIDNYVRITIGTDAQMDAFLQGTEAFLRGE